MRRRRLATVLGALLLLALLRADARPSSGNGRLLAVCIGVGSAASDAAALAQALRQQTAAYDGTSVRLLAGKAATAAHLRSTVAALRRQATPADTIVVAFVGTARTRGDRLILGNGLAWDDLAASLAGASRGRPRLLVLLDAHDAASGVTLGADGRRAAAQGILLVCARRPGERASRRGVDPAPFTEAVLAALAQGPATVADFVGCVQRLVPQVTNGAEHPFAPFLFDFDTDRVLFGTWQRSLGGAPPRCRFLSPANGEVVAGDRVRVSLEAVSEAGSATARFVVNGVVVPEAAARLIIAYPRDAQASPLGASGQVFQTDLPLPSGGRTVVLRAIVTDDGGQVGQAEVTLRRQSTAVEKGDLHVLAVGVSRYRNADYDLKLAAIDAAAVADTLRGQDGLYRTVHVTRLLDADATGARIRTGLDSLKAARPGDTCIVYLAGHGVQQDGAFYFAPHDVDMGDVRAAGLAWSDLTDALSGIYARKIVLADACGAGGGADTEVLATSVTPQEGLLLLASCESDQLSYERTDLGHGVFTAALLEGLGGRADYNGDGVVAMAELMNYVSTRTGELQPRFQCPVAVGLRVSLTAPVVRVR